MRARSHAGWPVRAAVQHRRRQQRRHRGGGAVPHSTGDRDVAAGARALVQNTTGNNNVATGVEALSLNTTGDRNVAAGVDALRKATGSRNVALGAGAGDNLTTGSDNVYIANGGQAGDSGTIRIGRPSNQTATFIAGISDTTLGGATQPVVVNANGRLGVAGPASSASATSLATTVERLNVQLKLQQRQIERLRSAVRRGG